MNYFISQQNAGLNPEEKKSAELLIERMGLDKKELELISDKYGVSALQLVEMIQYGKYKFVYEDKMPGS